MKNASDYRKLARETLKGKYWNIFIIVLLITIITAALSGIVLGFLLIGVLNVALAGYLLQVTNKKLNDTDAFDALYQSGKNAFVPGFVAHILTAVFIFLWSLLLLIPGIIKALAYSQTFYILAENPNMSGVDAITRSRALMQGHKTRLFFLYLSFIGWFILCLLTLGIGYIFLDPYIKVTLAHFYKDISGHNLNHADQNQDTVNAEFI